MTAITKTLIGLAGIISASAVICRLGALYGDKIRAALNSNEQQAFDAMLAACAVWDATKPISAD